jgi:hypothetical protein
MNIFSCFYCDTVEEEVIPEIPYCEKYLDKFDNLVINEKPLQFHPNSFVLENTPSGNVIMQYDEEAFCFLYYCDKYISNENLETVARKFVIQYDCKCIHHLRKEETEEKREKKAADIKEASVLDVYGKFKKRLDKQRKLIVSNINSYKHLGKLNEFSMLQKVPTKKQEVTALSYADFMKQ